MAFTILLIPSDQAKVVGQILRQEGPKLDRAYLACMVSRPPAAPPGAVTNSGKILGG